MAHDWGYTHANGPHTWAERYEQAAGQRQSPVNIETNSVSLDPKLTKNPLKWAFPSRLNDISNTGHGWKVDVSDDEQSVLQGGPLNDVYKMVQFHAHWGPDSSSGSEHQVDGQSFAAEIHFVHMNTKYYSFNEALKHGDGLAVIGVFVKAGKEHKDLNALVELLPKIKFQNQSVAFERNMDLNRLVPDNHAYWTYLGSLTTPPCNECVIWIVMKEPIEVSEEQLEAFRLMSCNEEDCQSEEMQIINNYRPPLPVGDRSIRASYN